MKKYEFTDEVGNARVCGNASIGNAGICEDARVCGNVRIPVLCGLDLMSQAFHGDLPEYTFTAFKKVLGKEGKSLILELEVPFDAERSSAYGSKCRCSKAEAIELYNLDGTKSEETEAHSFYDPNFIYRVGKVARVYDFDDNRWNECSSGIHFFMSFEEARDYK